MSSILKVDTVQDQDGNNIINENANTITIGASGDTITIPSGATFDASASTTTLPDDSVTLAKMASGTDGNLISYDASGNPVAVATGTDGQVLTSTGAGSPPVFETLPANTPAFEAYLGGSGGQAVSDNTVTLVQANTEVYDTDSAYDTSTYKFTPQTAGKYMVYGSIQNESGSNSNLAETYLYFKLNGSNIFETQNDYSANPGRSDIINGNIIVDMNGSSDYVELYGRINSESGSGQLFESNTQYKRATAFGAYRILT
jgi:hypothetical protein